MTFTYETCCVDSDGPSINAMVDAARDVTLKTFRKHCDSCEWETRMGYERSGGLPLSRDCHVSFHKSTVRHSAIEYIFTRR